MKTVENDVILKTVSVETYHDFALGYGPELPGRHSLPRFTGTGGGGEHYCQYPRPPGSSRRQRSAMTCPPQRLTEGDAIHSQGALACAAIADAAEIRSCRRIERNQ